MTARATFAAERERPCVVCVRGVVDGVWITVGPGADPENRRRFREGEPYEPVTVVVCRGCAFGDVGDETRAVPRGGSDPP